MSSWFSHFLKQTKNNNNKTLPNTYTYFKALIKYNLYEGFPDPFVPLALGYILPT